MRAGNPVPTGLDLRYAIPGLLLVLSLEILVLFGFVEQSLTFNTLLTVMLVIIPWTAVLISGKGFGSLGYGREALILHLGWGMVAGGVWRVLSILLNLAHLKLTGFEQISTDLFVLILWIPFVEETFFRGYLGQSIGKEWGPLTGAIVQAAVFALLPTHIAQGGWNLISILAFGLLSGWLLERRRSIWAPWAAHAFANVLPYVALAIY